MLRSGELCVCQITEVVGLAPSTVSAHLKELKQAGLVWIDAALSPLTDDPQLESDHVLVAELRRLPVEDLCRFGYEAAKAKMKTTGAAR
jgi:hypothetical protein